MASVAVGRVDVAVTEVEAVGEVSNRVGSRGPINTDLASDAKLISIAGIDKPAPHKEEWTKDNIIRITINWTSTSKAAAYTILSQHTTKSTFSSIVATTRQLPSLRI